MVNFRITTMTSDDSAIDKGIALIINMQKAHTMKIKRRNSITWKLKIRILYFLQ